MRKKAAVSKGLFIEFPNWESTKVAFSIEDEFDHVSSDIGKLLNPGDRIQTSDVVCDRPMDRRTGTASYRDARMYRVDNKKKTIGIFSIIDTT